ncbi:hypothetical protein NGB36_27560 [Streptomyces sp. RB6PN25]|uniref:Uncharacterized protein n=1 Tax=Streptomyces humicola TaxID=2953240 RepID=A0ABT1Q2T1_9ACTN|nr:hypothetical protein [Streptomyces humicola]MCQ4084231.1 hypothetical protein [Streptomyces humicola]
MSVSTSGRERTLAEYERLLTYYLIEGRRARASSTARAPLEHRSSPARHPAPIMTL